MKKIFIVVALIVCSISFGQTAGSPFQKNISEKFFPKTPSERAFEKFINIPEGNYSGVHGFSVPIYTIQGNEFSFPISIDYSGGGIKVDEISGTVGLGWNLNVGGVNFSQEIRGRQDGQTSYGGIHIENPLNFSPNDNPQDYETALNMVGQIEGVTAGCIKLMDGIESLNELNPDFFSYSLLNNRGKFIKDSDGNIHTVPKDDIIYNNNNILIDKKGIHYHFTSYLSSNTTFYTGTYQNSYSISFYIDKIVFPNGDEINFNYIQNQYTYISNYEFSQDVQETFYYGSTGEMPLEIEKRPYLTETTEYLISSVKYKNTVIDFKYKEVGGSIGYREDVKGAASLDKIEIKYLQPNSQYKMVKEYKLETDYFISRNGNTGELYTASNYPDSQYKKRLRLKSIKELRSSSQYTFEYYGEHEADSYGSNTDLPNRFSYNTDYWGVYNGTENNSPIETFTYYRTNSTPPENIIVWGADKLPSEDYAIVGSLSKVQLPTGGSQIFEYELDTYQVDYGPITETFLFPREFETHLYFDYDDMNYNEYQIDIEPTDFPEFDYRDGLDYRVEFYNNDAPPYDGVGNMPDQKYYYLQLFENDDNHPIGPRIIWEHAQTGDILLPKLNPEKNYYFKLFHTGDEPSNHPGHPEFVEIKIKLKWGQKDYKEFTNKNAGSLRTKSIILTDVDGSEKLKRTYLYENFEENSLSSGIYTGRNYGTATFTMKPCKDNSSQSNCSNRYCKYRTYYRTPNHLNLNSVYGKSVFYENVTEIYNNVKESNQNFKIEYEFKAPDLGVEYPSGYDTPIIHRTYSDYTGGMLLHKRVFDDSNTIVKTFENTYAEPDYYYNAASADYLGNSIVAYGMMATIINEEIVCTVSAEGFCVPRYEFGTNYYYITSAWIKLDKTIEKDYSNGQLTVTTETDYEYDTTYSHLNPVTVKTTNSLGETIVTEYKYPQDLAGQRPWMSTLVAENRIADPVVVKTKNQTLDKPLSIQETVYEKDATTANIVLPKYVFAKKGSQTLNYSPTGEDLRITYDKYDSNGNLLQYTLANGTPVSIIWGYNGQYPIAKVEGLPYSSVQTEANALISASNSGSLSPASFETLRNTAGAMVTGYIYEPLVGVTTIIQSNGQIETYEYDNAGRLKLIMDQNGKVLKEIEYNYYNQQP